MKGLISIIVPIYNCSKYIDKCVNSLLKQKYSNLEIILVDDGSTDDSLAKCLKYQKKDSRVKVFHQENNGVSSARNIGIKSSSGQYISFIDSDDWIHEDYYNILINGYSDSSIDLSVVGVKVVYDLDDDSTTVDSKYSIIDRKSAYNKMFTDKDFFGFPVNKLYKRSIIDQIEENPFEENIYACEDTLFNAKYISKCQKINVNKSKLYFYYQRQDSATKNKNFNPRKLTVFDSLKKISDILEKESPENLESLYEFYMYNYYLIVLLLKKSNLNYKLNLEETKKYYTYLLHSNKLTIIKKIKIVLKFRFPIVFEMLLKLKKGK